MTIADNVIIFLLLNLLFTYFIWLFMRIKEIDKGLIKFYLVGGFISVIVVFLTKKDIYLLLLTGVYFISLIFSSFLSTFKVALLIFILLNILLMYKSFNYFISDLKMLHSISLVGTGLSSALAFKNLVLGHWYLVTPNMSIKHFKNLNVVFSIFSFIRIIFLVCVYFVINKNFSLFILRHNFFDALFFCKLILLQISPFLISLMSQNALSYGSTQSATGFFYVIAVFTLSDFIVSLYLLRNNFIVF